MKVVSPFIDNIWVAGLAGMQLISNFNKGFRYLLSAIDIYSAANIFGHFHPKKRNLADKVDKLSCPFNLFNKGTCFWLKLNQLLSQTNNQL